jgi:hypothetical protein
VKLLVATFCLTSLCAQDSSTYRLNAPDINGRRVDQGVQVTSSKSATGSAVTERLQSINGRMVPWERVEERVLRDDASGRVVERWVRHYDQTGNPTPPEKSLIEETKRPGGGSTVRTTTWRGDVNGGMAVTERKVQEVVKTGSGETAETLTERPTVNGGLEAVEKTSSVKTQKPNGFDESTVIYRKGASGFYEAVRLVKDHTEAPGQSVDNTAEYEVGSTGSLELHSQDMRRTVKRADGSEQIDVDSYGKFVAGTVRSASDRGLVLKEREIIERTPVAGSAVRETYSVQRPALADPNRLEPAKVIAEAVCKGKCDSAGLSVAQIH